MEPKTARNIMNYLSLISAKGSVEHAKSVGRLACYLIAFHRDERLAMDLMALLLNELKFSRHRFPEWAGDVVDGAYRPENYSLIEFAFVEAFRIYRGEKIDPRATYRKIEKSRESHETDFEEALYWLRHMHKVNYFSHVALPENYHLKIFGWENTYIQPKAGESG